MNPDKPEQSTTFTDSYPCPYFSDGRISTTEFLIPDQNQSLNFHDYLARGYRRIGRAFYRNICSDCTACLPLRVRLDNFKASKSQKRTLKLNSDIEVRILDTPEVTIEKVALYEKYLKSKHPDDEKSPPDPASSVLNMHYGYHDIIEIDYFINGRLIAAGIVDNSLDALSSNYFYYDTEHLQRRLGVFSMLQEIETARMIGKEFFYLGFYIEDNQKMAYKKYFRPNEVLVDGIWKGFL
ncbi:MAG: arginyltransferase [Nitrospira sp.]|nr:arginyltransferase [bacterium]MBL7049217.1 arginyltransferase [Nitrospira sp.]